MDLRRERKLSLKVREALEAQEEERYVLKARATQSVSTPVY